MNINSAKCLTYASLAGLLSMSAISTGYAEDISTKPDGYHVVPSQNSPGMAIFNAKVDRTAKTIEYELSWNNLQGDIIQSHIHFGRPASNGDIVLFLCTNIENTPATAAPAPLCSDAGGDPRNGTVKGVLQATDIVAVQFGSATGSPTPLVMPENQLLPFKDFEELANAIDAGATYVVVHTKGAPEPEQNGQPTGELRGDIGSIHSQVDLRSKANDVNAQPATVVPDNRRLKNVASATHP